MGKLGNLGFVVMSCGVEMNEIAKGALLDVIAILFGKIGDLATVLGSKAKAVCDKATNLKALDSGDKFVNTLESDFS